MEADCIKAVRCTWIEYAENVGLVGLLTGNKYFETIIVSVNSALYSKNDFRVELVLNSMKMIEAFQAAWP